MTALVFNTAPRHRQFREAIQIKWNVMKDMQRAIEAKDLPKFRELVTPFLHTEKDKNIAMLISNERALADINTMAKPLAGYPAHLQNVHFFRLKAAVNVMIAFHTQKEVEIAVKLLQGYLNQVD